jgi:hypothetical protein
MTSTLTVPAGCFPGFKFTWIVLAEIAALNAFEVTFDGRLSAGKK